MHVHGPRTFFLSSCLSAAPAGLLESSWCVFERASRAEMESMTGWCVYWA